MTLDDSLVLFVAWDFISNSCKDWRSVLAVVVDAVIQRVGIKETPQVHALEAGRSQVLAHNTHRKRRLLGPSRHRFSFSLACLALFSHPNQWPLASGTGMRAR